MTAGSEGRRASFDLHLEHLKRHVDLKGKRVLEIGGDRWRYVSTEMIDAGADYVETINIVPGWPEGKFVAPKIFCRKLDCRELSQVHGPDSFDVIFGMAVAEHISGLDLFLIEAAKVLKPGGIFYLHGGPLWTATKGHHLYHRVGDRLYTFADKDCPIEQWEHLMTDADGLAERIAQRGVAPDTARILADWVYTTDEQNRVGYNAQLKIFEAGPLDLVERIDSAFFSPNADQLAAIVAMGHDPDDRYDASGVSHIMRRP